VTSPLDDPFLFFDEIAKPNVEQFLTKPDDLRLAINAVLTLDAVAGYMHAWAAKHSVGQFCANDGELRSAFARLCEPMGHLRDMANALKQTVLTRSIFLVSASDIENRALGWDASLWDQGRWDSPAQLCFDSQRGGVVILEQWVTSAMVFLQNELNELRLQKESIDP
jgi:hypothetical protein